ncbi:hypothetical protein ACLIT5_000005 [Citrobacter koseri]
MMISTTEEIKKQTSEEEIRRENLYHTKCQCLAEVLGKQSFIHITISQPMRWLFYANGS